MTMHLATWGSFRFFLCGQPIVDHLVFDHLKSVFFNSTSILKFTILLGGTFTHIRLMLQMMPPPLSLFFFSSSCLSPTATAMMSGLSFSSALTLRKKILENFILQLQDLNPQSSSLFTIKNFACTRDWSRVCSLIMSLMHILLISIDADTKMMKSEIGSTRRDLVALFLEVPCHGRWCRCQTYPTWAPKHSLPS